MAQLTTGAHPLLNVAASASAAAGFVSLRPCGVTTATSLLNTAWSEPVANVGTVPVAAATKVCVSSSSATGMLVDRVGHFVVAPG